MGIQGILNTPVRFGAKPSHRDAIIARHLAKTNSPAFRRAYRDTFESARKHIAQQRAAGRPGFVVFDVDETVLDNRGYFADPKRQYFKRGTDIASMKQGWNAWVAQPGPIPVIPGARRLIEWLNRENVPYVFLTGISERLKDASVAKLKQAGVWGKHCLGAFYRTSDFSFPNGTAAFKERIRPVLEKRFGMPIVASIGDHPRDMTGDPQRDFLLPDYVKGLRAALAGDK